jgi:HPt (histidine-containing phosphotransfer) domain-containing protein
MEQPPKGEIVSMDRLRQVSLEDDEFLLELLQTYLEDAVKQRADLAQAAAAEDVQLLAERAHRIKGGASNLGADSLARLCAELERSAKLGEPRADLSEAVQSEMMRVAERLEEVVGSLTAGR